MLRLLENLPDALRRALVHGSEGARHLSFCAGLAAQARKDRLAAELLLAAWAESPLDASLAAQAANLHSAPESARELARHVAANTAAPADLTYYRRLAQRRDAPKIAAYLDAQAAKEPGNLFWTAKTLFHALDAEDWERATASAAPLPEPLARLVESETALLSGDAPRALANASRLARLWECPGLEQRLGLAFLGQGDPDQAGRWLRAGIAREPWRTRSLLLLHDLEHGLREAAAPLPGRTAVLLYTWNKAREIDLTLQSLLASRLHGATVVVLDNGSTDDTPQVLRAWTERAGGQRLETVRLPVNVGAPVARNWLASLETARAAEWIVYLDDDVSLPEDWLERLGAAASLYPDAGVWGARVREYARPSHVQSADVFLLPPDEEGGAFSLSSCHHEALDRGHLRAVRPCATVTGCCHLFRAATLQALGGFDLRFSPSQYDDLDHDIRLLLSGKAPVCQGHLAVGHFKATGSQGQPGQAQYGLGHAHQFKLRHKHSAGDYRRAAALADRLAWEDLRAKALAAGEAHAP
ncbi:N-acetylglucosaminyl-diphospho-decaprenol L-rhamnosyltransferase [Fundidesulfovibrio magnetotacticus]|uniref:N-acetylglucosaminyl-diphospho-decaprenol L-rhamnosyltransferase n=1 Tax=Fundidesulfovibrio magnetotacticus TaxID=2730080 RepID=A0A6V8LXQ2_9BACT|nr:glycosyltransferase [Fundidesulfovibrio magnetotacticus]GFK93055.1 N-acetylglucosaminyl-diphospho-decaprenol L-rhamnosyltransferase [Fundidesulfovibrio magnetotacticus]